ncbi:HupE/UreJ family protein [Ahrensia sp. 13_GOM-1096m]|uniref:HupE/UreJ family protein n=1 Tax=Ahrensia sp. 13_GOM-1096m TaxID=1380380 RepID=UPI00054F6C82
MHNLLREGLPFKQFALWRLPLVILLVLAILPLMEQVAWAHAVTEGDKGYIQEISGVKFIPFMYLGAKHMITGYDHLLFLAGVIFFLYRMKHIGIYVTLFAIGHSTTMILGVYYNITMSSYIIDAIIGLSVVYKALDNMGAYQRWFGFQPNTKAATLIFGLFHGFGLATKVQDYEIAQDGLLTNLIAFNIGVEVGQLLALAAILISITYWRRSGSFWKHAYTANVVMMTAGFILVGMHLTGFFAATNS